MRKATTWLLLAWFAVALAGCETIKGIARDIGNLGDVLSGKKPSHKTFKSEKPKEARQQATQEQGQAVGPSEKAR